MCDESVMRCMIARANALFEISRLSDLATSAGSFDGTSGDPDSRDTVANTLMAFVVFYFAKLK